MNGKQKDRAKASPPPKVLAPAPGRACGGCGTTNIKLHLYRVRDSAKDAYLCAGCLEANIALEHGAKEMVPEGEGLPPGAEDKTVEEAAPAADAAGLPAKKPRPRPGVPQCLICKQKYVLNAARSYCLQSFTRGLANMGIGRGVRIVLQNTL